MSSGDNFCYERPYRLAHQHLSISNINLNQRTLIGFTQLTIWPLIPNLKQIYLNCKQCCIHRIQIEPCEDILQSNPDTILPDPIDVPIAYNDPSLVVFKSENKSRTLDAFSSQYSKLAFKVDADYGTGEIVIRIPANYTTYLGKLNPVRLTIEFSLNKPKSGLYFVTSGEDDCFEDKTIHCFTSVPPNSSRLWFPCIDCSEPCTWKIEITVEEDLVAVASGDLIDAPYYSDNLRFKTYHFYVAQPISAPYIGFAVGAFSILPDAKANRSITYFYLKPLSSIVKHSIGPIHEIIEYYESVLTTQLPLKSFKIVFVDQAYEDYQSYASLLIFSVDLLHSSRIIDQAVVSRRIFAQAMARQFFGCFMPMKTFCDAWLAYGIAGYLSGLYQKRVFGNNEYRHFIASEMHHVTTYEHNKHGVILDPSSNTNKSTYFNLTLPQVISPDYFAVYCKKAHLVIRMIELRLGQPVLLQVLNKLLVLAGQSVDFVHSTEPSNEGETEDNGFEEVANVSTPKASLPQYLPDELRQNLLLSTDNFKRIISTVTGQDIRNFLEHWVWKPGHVRLFVKFNFNRKRNIVELELKQDLQSRSTLNYTGPISAMMQEIDGPFVHTFKLEEGRSSRDLPCHSKSRKHKKKKISLSNGEEVDMDLARVEADSPLLWVRLDPDLAVIKHIRMDMSDFMWHLMATYDRDCLGQMEAVSALTEFASHETRVVLSNLIADERVFYRVRMEACFAICCVVNELASVGGLSGTQASSCLIPYFWQLYSSPANRNFIRQNDFSYLQHYFLQKTIVRAIATLRVQQVCPREVLTFLVDLSRYNDNSRNNYSDCYYRADLIKAIKDTLTPAIITRGIVSVSSLPVEAKIVVEEVARCLNLDTQIPSYKGTVTVACLSAIHKLQRFGFLPVEPSFFYQYITPGHYYSVRLAAIECLIDFISGERDQMECFDKLFRDIIENPDQSYASNRLRCDTIKLFLRIPPFQRSDTGSRLDVPDTVERLWKLMNQDCSHDSRLRCVISDLYYNFYGKYRPTCLPVPEGVLHINVREGKSVLKFPSEKTLDGDIGDESNSSTFSLKRTGMSMVSVDDDAPSTKRTERLSDDEDILL